MSRKYGDVDGNVQRIVQPNAENTANRPESRYQQGVKMADEDAPLPRSRHGGWRPGAGRKRGAVDRVRREPRPVREAFGALYARRMQEESAAIVEAAVTASRSGDNRVLLDTLNRFLGRPVQAVEVSGPGGTPVRLQALAATALALMSTQELRALESFNDRIAALGPAPGGSVTDSAENDPPPK
jgi:hypothetical protein